MGNSASEYIAYVDHSNYPTPIDSWTITSPNATVWGPTISTSGVITLTSGATAATTPLVIGIDGVGWALSIDNGGVVSITSGSSLTYTDSIATLTDSSGINWTLFVDESNQLRASSSPVILSMFRFPSVVMSWTPTSSADAMNILSVRVSMTMRTYTA